MTVKDRGKCGFCKNAQIIGENRNPFVCDVEGTAKKCRLFECSNTPESVEEDFEKILRSPAICGEVYPKLAIMIWFLQSSARVSRAKRFGNSVLDMFRAIFNFLLVRWW